jgi:hypothetical protein
VADDAAARERFQREAKVIAALSHPDKLPRRETNRQGARPMGSADQP